MKRADLLSGHPRILNSPIERLTRRVFTRVVTALARTMRDQELTVAQIAVLHLLDQDGEARISSLAGRSPCRPRQPAAWWPNWSAGRW